MTRIGGRSQLRVICLPYEAAAEGQQGIGRQAGARKQGERRGRVAAHRAEAAHLFRLVGARVTKMLSAERRRAAPDGIPARVIERAR